MEIITLLACLNPVIDYTTIRQLSTIAEAILSMSGRVTMLGISRWTDGYGSYRTVQRLFYSKINWVKLRWLFIRKHLIKKGDVILIGGDDVIVSKSGKETYGLGRFFSSLQSQTISGLRFLALSLISVGDRNSYPTTMEQIVKEESSTTKQDGKKGRSSKSNSNTKRGRPKGSCNKNRKDVELSPYLQLVQAAIKELLNLIGTDLSLVYFVFDGAFGNNAALQMVRQCNLHLISKLRYDSALYFPYSGEYCGRGRPKKYGDKLNCKKIPAEYLKGSDFDGYIQTYIYQMQVWHKLFPELLNVVIMVKTNLRTGKTKHIILFSSDLELSYDKLIEYYSLRFQIEFNFRDAKQYWGLEDFMNISKNAVYNAANLAMFMVNLPFVLLEQNPIIGSSIEDLKAWFRARKYVVDTLKLSGQNADPILIERIVHNVSKRGRINPSNCQI